VTLPIHKIHWHAPRTV